MRRISEEALSSMEPFLKLDLHHTVEVLKAPEDGFGRLRRHFAQVVNIYSADQAEKKLSAGDLKFKEIAELNIKVIDELMETTRQIRDRVAALPTKFCLRDPAHEEARERERREREQDRLSRRVSVTVPDPGRPRYQSTWKPL